ncbi:MAG: hypothetical protein R8K54_06865 [Mariprofundaceae bacterium]
MDWELLLVILPIGVFLWWAGFYATKQMRIGKNKEREELAKRLLAEKAAREAVNETAESSSESKEQEAH